LIIVANCREKTARSLSLILGAPMPGIFSSFLRPEFVTAMLMGA